jgi:ATP-dependent Clp protease ATP-binding subunit ClpA
MSVFMEKHSVSRIVGSPPAMWAMTRPGSSQKDRRAYSVVLFDEIEKAHPT